MSSLETNTILDNPLSAPGPLSRRRFLQRGGALLAAGYGFGLAGCAPSPLPETETRIRVPRGFEPRLVARSGYPSTPNSEYLWHVSPDGGACFDTESVTIRLNGRNSSYSLADFPAPGAHNPKRVRIRQLP